MYIFLKPSKIFCIGGKIVDVNFIRNDFNSKLDKIEYIGVLLKEKNINNSNFKEILKLKKKKKKLDKLTNSKEIFSINNIITNLSKLWEEIIFFKIIDIQKNNFKDNLSCDNVILEVSEFLLPYNPKSGLKIGDRINVNIEFINYIKLKSDNNNNTLNLYSYQSNIITDWNGNRYKQNSLDTLINIIDKESIIRVQLSYKNSYKIKIFIKIIGFNSKRDWIIGKPIKNYKDLNDLYYRNISNLNMDCLYYFNKKSIIEIPCDNGWQTQEISIKLINKLK